MSNDIPLINDILKSFPNVNIGEHIDSKMLEMYESFLNNENKEYTSEEIYKYIKFINLTCLDPKCYKHVVSYINKNNFPYFANLLEIYDIMCELLPLLPYSIVSQCSHFKDIRFKETKEKWFVNNIEWVMRYDTEMLKPYSKYKSKYAEYFLIDDKIFGKHKNINFRVKKSLRILYDLKDLSEKGHLDIIKYLLEKLDPIFHNVYLTEVNISSAYNSGCDVFGILSSSICNAANNNHFEVVKYFAEFIKSKNQMDLFTRRENEYANYPTLMNDAVRSGNLEMVKYIMEIMRVNINDALLTAAVSGANDILTYLLENGGDINSVGYGDDDRNLLSEASCNEHIETVKILVERGIDVRRFGYSAIDAASFDKHLDIIIYILNVFKEKGIKVNKTRLLESVTTNETKYSDDIVFKYIFDNYFDNKVIEDRRKMLQYMFLDDNNDNIKNFIEKDFTINFMNIRTIFEYRSEENCISLFEYFKVNNIYICNIDEIVKQAADKGYVSFILKLYNGNFNIYPTEKLRDMTIDVITELLIYSSPSFGKEDENITINSITFSEKEKCLIELIEQFFKEKTDDLKKITRVLTCRGFLNLVKYFVNVLKNDININDLLILSCEYGELPIVKYLVENGADVKCNILDHSINNIYHKKYLNNTVIIVLNIVKYLLSNGADVIKALYFINKYFYIYEKDNYTFLIKSLCDIYLSDTYFENSLMFEVIEMIIKTACDNDCFELIVYMIGKGVNINSIINKTLEKASRLGRADVVKCLLELNEREGSINFLENKSLVLASKHGHIDIVKMLISHINVNNFNGEALVKACKYEHLEVVVFLIENSAEIAVNDNNALKNVLKYQYLDILKYLIEKGADRNIIEKNYKWNNVEINNYLEGIGFVTIERYLMFDVNSRYPTIETGEYSD